MSQSSHPEWGQATYWQKRFETCDTPWELGRPSIVLLEALAELESRGFVLTGARVLSPGCGTGSDAVEFARRGAQVIGVDWSDAAVVALSQSPVRILQGNMFVIQPELVDLVCEHTFFCAIDPSMRTRYVETISKWLPPGGFLIGNFFVVPEDYARTLAGLSLTEKRQGPPFGTTTRELEELFSPYFETQVLRPAKAGEPSRRAGLEWVGVFRRRAT